MTPREQPTSWTEIRVRLPNVLVLLVVVGAASFAAGSAMPGGPSPVVPAAEPSQPAAELRDPDDDLPPGHPAVDPAERPGDPGAASADTPSSGDELPVRWVMPPRWQLAPNPSSMRLATYRVPRATGDTGDAELSIARAGGSPDANAERWVQQFDAEGQKTAKQTTRKVGSLEVLVVEVEGAYAGGMGKESGSQPGWALLGAIVELPDMPLFFKLVGPAKSVRAARGEFDAMIGSITPK